MKNYHLGFISDEDVFNHVRETVVQYRTYIDLKEFNRNIIDPIKLTFDAKVYGKTFKEIVDAECVRQIDKTNSNRIGYFHQNIFRYAPGGWEVPTKGFDVINKGLHIYAELKNKHNTMNSAAGRNTYIKMQNQLLKDDGATCLLVETIAARSQNKKWAIGIDGTTFSHERIRRVSMDKFYEIVFGDKTAFCSLCRKLPDILDDVVACLHRGTIDNKVHEELKELSSDTFKSLYLLAFKTYDGFDNL